MREQSSAFHGVERVGRRRDAQHITVAEARTHESGLFVLSAVQEDVPQLVPEAAAEEPGDQELRERFRACARAEHVDEGARATHPEKYQLPGASLHEWHPAERGLAGRVFSQGFLVPFHRNQAVAAVVGWIRPADTHSMRRPDRSRFRQDGGGRAHADRKLLREDETDCQLRGHHRGLRRRGR